MEAIDRHLFDGEALPPGLADAAYWQERALRLIRWWGRRERRACLDALHARLMSEDAFRTEIESIFKL